MKALFFDGKLSLREVPKPERAPGEALIKVLLAGICGTDREILKGYSGFHGIPGHEFVGRVEECDDSRWLGQARGGRNQSCLRPLPVVCKGVWVAIARIGRYLGIVNRPGVFAEYVDSAGGESASWFPTRFSDQAATFTEPVAAACEILEQMTLAQRHSGGAS
jgi:alcohol dehydrogenase